MQLVFAQNKSKEVWIHNENFKSIYIYIHLIGHMVINDSATYCSCTEKL